MTGDLMGAARAAEIGLVNHAVPDGRARCGGRSRFAIDSPRARRQAIRWTKTVVNLELKRIAHAAMDAGIAYETLSVRTRSHAEAVSNFATRRGGGSKT